MAEKFPTATPYNYCFNNPISLNDPNGMDPTADEQTLINYYQQFYPWVKTIDDVTSVVNGQTQDPNAQQDNSSASNNEQKTNWDYFVDGIPFVGSYSEYCDAMNSGEYYAAVSSLGFAIFDIVDFGTGTLVKFIEKGAAKEVEVMVAKSATKMGVKKFTEKNFRTNLIKLTGKNIKNAQAHHVFPKGDGLRDMFLKKGIDVDLPIFGVWWETTSHQANKTTYNKAWLEYMSTNPTTSQILQKGREMLKTYGIKVNY